MRTTNLLLISLVLVASTVFAQQDHTCQGGHNCNDNGDIVIGGTDIDVASDVSISGDKAFGLGQGSFGVDINQCMASTAWNFVIFGKQGLKENATCIADGLDARGNHAAAARVRCKHVDTVMDSFDSFDQCVKAVTMSPLQAPGIIPDPAIETDKERSRDEFRKLRDELNAIVAENSRKLETASRQARQQRKRNQEDREYAQQMIEQIRQIEEPPNDE